MKRSVRRGLGVIAAVVVPIAGCGGKIESSCDPHVDTCTPTAPAGGSGGATTRCEAPVECGSGISVKLCTTLDAAGICRRKTYVLSDREAFDCATCGDCTAAYARAFQSACDVTPEPVDAAVPPPPPPPYDAGPTPGTCAPADMSGFVPAVHPPARIPGACTQAQIDAYLKCIGDASGSPSSPACTQMSQPESAACVACILTPASKSAYGPLIQLMGTIELNVAGCVSLATNDPSGGGCGGIMQGARECLEDACTSCPITDQASFEAEQQCESDAAAANPCAAYQSKAQCVDSYPAAAKCTSGASFDELYSTIVPLFCL